jgi:hypothetical protein
MISSNSFRYYLDQIMDEERKGQEAIEAAKKER